jgi:hypothetical protein
MLTFATGVTAVVTDAELPSEVSVRFAGAATVAVLVKVPVALPETVPLTVKLTELGEFEYGNVGIVALTLLPETPITVGQIAPPVVALHTAITPLIEAGTKSENDVPPAALGPIFVTVMV